MGLWSALALISFGVGRCQFSVWFDRWSSLCSACRAAAAAQPLGVTPKPHSKGSASLGYSACAGTESTLHAVACGTLPACLPAACLPACLPAACLLLPCWPPSLLASLACARLPLALLSPRCPLLLPRVLAPLPPLAAFAPSLAFSSLPSLGFALFVRSFPLARPRPSGVPVGFPGAG